MGVSRANRPACYPARMLARLDALIEKDDQRIYVEVEAGSGTLEHGLDIGGASDVGEDIGPR